MAKDPERRQVWTQEATDYALAHGLIGLSLRPLAASLGSALRAERSSGDKSAHLSS